MKNFLALPLILAIAACGDCDKPLKPDTTKAAFDIKNYVYSGDVLHKKAEEIDPLSEGAKEIAEVLLATAYGKQGCVGLAAPQIGIGKRIFVFMKNLHDQNSWEVAINPSYNPIGNKEYKSEGCFSVPHFYSLKVPRYARIHYCYTTLEGNVKKGQMDGFTAHVFQHETDHLNGLLYIDLLENRGDLLTEQAIKQLREKQKK